MCHDSYIKHLHERIYRPAAAVKVFPLFITETRYYYIHYHEQIFYDLLSWPGLCHCDVIILYVIKLYSHSLCSLLLIVFS